MAETNFLQYPIVTQFILPFLLMFVLVFALLEKTKVLGENKQVNAIISFVIGLIFTAAIFPKLVVANLILFLTVALVVFFVVLLLWGFVSGSTGVSLSDKLKWPVGIFIVIAVAIAVLWATGVHNDFFDFLFKQTWSKTFWTNVIFIAAMAAALAVVLKSKTQ